MRPQFSVGITALLESVSRKTPALGMAARGQLIVQAMPLSLKRAHPSRCDDSLNELICVSERRPQLERQLTLGPISVSGQEFEQSPEHDAPQLRASREWGADLTGRHAAKRGNPKTLRARHPHPGKGDGVRARVSVQKMNA